MSSDFELIQLQIETNTLTALSNRRRNQIVGCMHAHNELSCLNRLLMFSLNDVAEGLPHDQAHGVQMWCVMQVLIGKIYETWNMIAERFLQSNPEDAAITSLSAKHKLSLDWLKGYFGDQRPNETPLRTIRDKTAFHYDKLNLQQAVVGLAEEERRLYLAEHPANAMYYIGSTLVFSTVFAMIADKAIDTDGMTQAERVHKGVDITMDNVNEANLHLNNVLHGLILPFVETLEGATHGSAQIRIPVVGAPKPTRIALPMFVDV